MMGVIPNEWVEANSSVDKTAKLFSKAPGRRFPGSTGSMDPEDYAKAAACGKRWTEENQLFIISVKPMKQRTIVKPGLIRLPVQHMA